MALLLDVVEGPYSSQNIEGSKNWGVNKNNFFPLFCFLENDKSKEAGIY
jgi:hypothetical protein